MCTCLTAFYAQLYSHVIDIQTMRQQFLIPKVHFMRRIWQGCKLLTAFFVKDISLRDKLLSLYLSVTVKIVAVCEPNVDGL